MAGAQRAGLPTQEQRSAGLGVLVLGGLNAVLGLLLTLAAMNAGEPAALLYGAVAAGGVVLVALGRRIRQGSRAATVAAMALMGVLAVGEIVLLVTAPDGQAVFRLIVTGLVLWLLARAYRSS
jgi:hypothetical protein